MIFMPSGDGYGGDAKETDKPALHLREHCCENEKRSDNQLPREPEDSTFRWRGSLVAGDAEHKSTANGLCWGG
jgi:hypothetical protein